MHLPLTGFHSLPGGPRVRLRLATVRDIEAIQRLLAGAGSGVEAGQLVRIDPRRRIVICALALIGTAERVVGVAAMDAGASEPDLVCIDEALGGGLTELLERALAARALALASRAA
ncbi:MAG TPA: hypothetical protein VGI87_08995 [Solirubrobacteraceae bacterium]|jgi:hypothetical protein